MPKLVSRLFIVIYVSEMRPEQAGVWLIGCTLGRGLGARTPSSRVVNARSTKVKIPWMTSFVARLPNPSTFYHGGRIQSLVIDVLATLICEPIFAE